MNDAIKKLLDELGIPEYSHDEPARLKPTDERIFDALLRYTALRGRATCMACQEKIDNEKQQRAAGTSNV
jgi:hypothetical protein